MKNKLNVMLSVVIVSYNRLDILGNHLRRYLENSDLEKTEFIVVDNGSSDGSQEFLQEMCREFPILKVIQHVQNVGVGPGRNAGYRAANGDVILSLDEDAWLDPRDWATALAYFERDKRIGVLAPRVIHGQTGQEQGVFLAPLTELANYHGAGHFIRRSCLITVNFLDEYCFFGGEEIDLSMRLKDKGYLTLHAPELCVKHFSFLRSGSEGYERRLNWSYAYGRVFSKNLTSGYAVVLLTRKWLASLSTIGRGTLLKFGWQSAVATVRGFRDGLKVHSPLSRDAMEFYRRQDLLPEFGNLPLMRKLARSSK